MIFVWWIVVFRNIIVSLAASCNRKNSFNCCCAQFTFVGKSRSMLEYLAVMKNRIRSIRRRQKSVRGTGIYLESEADLSYDCSGYGQTRIVADADPNVRQEVVSEHHDSPTHVLPSASNGKLIVPAPFINHTDSELALIEKLVGRTTPFAYIGGGYEVPRKRSY